MQVAPSCRTEYCDDLSSAVSSTDQLIAAPDDVGSIAKRLTKANLIKRLTMAISESTSQQLISGKSQPRRLTVGYIASSARAGLDPHIRIMGKWVGDAGFPVGSKVNVDVSHGRLVIELAPPEAVCKSPPARRAYVAERMAMTVDHCFSEANGCAERGGNPS